ncbi:MAG: tetratricopeptide repeat protein [Ardenticatenaceae bacterium]
MNANFNVQNRFRELHSRHIGLLRGKQGASCSSLLVEEAESLLYELRASGREISDSAQRRRLESYAAYWGAFIYDETGSYPDTSLILAERAEVERVAGEELAVVGGQSHQVVIYQADEPSAAPFLAPPMPPYELVGRDALLQALKARLFAGDHLALSALNGLPGVGKTALAVALAHDSEVRAHFQDGVLWAGLGPDADVMAWLGKWGSALGIGSDEMSQLSTLESRVDRIRTTIGARKMLLVVDDAWSVNAGLTFKLGGPNCSHIVTTRFPQIALRFAGNGAQAVGELSEVDGLMLLKQLAPQVVDAEPDAAQELVQTVGGLPLALVLMGNYLRLEGYDGRKRRIRRALKKLKKAQARMALDEGQVPAQRHPSLPSDATISLGALIAVSDEVLDEVARRTLYALSLFPPKPNTFSEDAALAVSGEAAEALDTLTDYGLLDSRGEERYTLHPVIADYAALNRSDDEAISRMVDFFIGYLETQQKDKDKDYDALEEETDNILVALQAAFEHDMPQALVQGSNLFYHFLEVRGLYGLAETLLLRAEQACRGQMGAYDEDWSAQSRDLITTLLNLGRTTHKRGHYTQAEGYYQEGLAGARALGQQEIISHFLQNLGAVAGKRGAYDQEEAYYQEGLALARTFGLRERISSLLANLGAVAMDRGEYDQAESYLLEGLALARTLDNPEISCRLLTNQGVVAERRGAYDQAEAYYQEGLVLARSLGHREKITRLLLNLGDVARMRGAYHSAEVHYQEGLSLAQALGDRWLISFTLVGWGQLHLKRQRWNLAASTFRDALQIAQTLGIQQHVADALYGLARVAFAQGNTPAARQQAQESLAIFRAMGHRNATQVKEWLEEHGKG